VLVRISVGAFNCHFFMDALIIFCLDFLTDSDKFWDMVAALDEQTVKKICYKEMERWCA
jgi:hypothetical protein